MSARCALFFIFTGRVLAAVNAQNNFVTVECSKENFGWYGQQSLLQCSVKLSNDVQDVTIRTVTWKKMEGTKENERPFLVFHEGKLEVQEPGYRFADPSFSEKNMNISLLITNTEVAHNGSYKCSVITDSGDDTGTTCLKVRADYSEPTIHSIPKKIIEGRDSKLICQSGGGFPKGRLRWFDVHNADWTASAVMVANQAKSGLFQLESTLPLKSGSTFSDYSCAVFNASGVQAFRTQISLGSHGTASDQDSRSDPELSKIIAPLVIIGSLIVGLLLLFLFCRRRSQHGHCEVPVAEADDNPGDEREPFKKNEINMA
ncbi:uncharacterized protein KZ484_024877 isoform 2-T2 [Pholidichthys leucotaenia]